MYIFFVQVFATDFFQCFINDFCFDMMYRVFIEHCVFSKILKYILGSGAVSVCTELGIDKRNKKVKKKESTLSTKKATKEKRKKQRSVK